MFSSVIKRACEVGSLQGINLSSHGPTLSHLFFAYDSCSIFLTATTANCQEIMRIIDVYCVPSGQLVNQTKSTLYCTPNMPEARVHYMCKILGVPATLNPGRYLGLPTIWGRSKKVSLSFIKAKLVDKIPIWKLFTLSMVGRENLIKSMAQAVPTFPMHCFKFPATLCKKLDVMMVNFW